MHQLCSESRVACLRDQQVECECCTLRKERHLMRKWGLVDHAREHGGPENNSGLYSTVINPWGQVSDVVRLEC